MQIDAIKCVYVQADLLYLSPEGGNFLRGGLRCLGAVRGDNFQVERIKYWGLNMPINSIDVI